MISWFKNPNRVSLALFIILCLFFLMAFYFLYNRAQAKAPQQLNTLLLVPDEQWILVKPLSSIYPFNIAASELQLDNMLDAMNFPVISQRQNPEVQIQEGKDTYCLKIPLRNPWDSDKVQVHVAPHAVQIDMEVVSKIDNVSYSASRFMQTFHTSAELDTRHVNKSTKNNILTVTIPKFIVTQNQRHQASPFSNMSPANFI